MVKNIIIRFYVIVPTTHFRGFLINYYSKKLVINFYLKLKQLFFRI